MSRGGSYCAALLLVVSVGCAARTAPPKQPAAEAGWNVVPRVTLVEAKTESDCGAAALQMVLVHWSPGLDEADVERTLGPPDSAAGYRAGLLRNAARAHGLNAFVIEAEVADLVHEVSLGHPVIVGIVTTRLGSAFTHYQVVVGTDATGHRLLIADPVGTWTRVDAEQFLKEWRPTRQLAVIIFPEDEPEPMALR